MKNIYMQLWHAKVPTFTEIDVLPNSLNKDYVIVDQRTIIVADGATNLDAADAYYAATQNLEESWKEGTRSTSVGDLMVVLDDLCLDEVLCVAPLGFKSLFKIEETEEYLTGGST
jgi:hypothetical protein